MSITNFIANFQGGARPNRFRVQITWPTAVGTPNVQDEFVVNAAQLPGYMTGVVQVPYKGRTIPVPGDRTFEDWVCTVMNDLSMSHRNAFERWNALCNLSRENIQGVPSYKDLLATIDVSQLGPQDEVIKTVKMYNAWPNNVMPIDLSYSDNDIISQFQVSMSYSHWE